MNDSSTALRMQKGSCPEELCWLLLLLCLLGALLFLFSWVLPAGHVKPPFHSCNGLSCQACLHDATSTHGFTSTSALGSALYQQGACASLVIPRDEELSAAVCFSRCTVS